MNVGYCTYDPSTGRIHMVGSCDGAILDRQMIDPGFAMLQLDQPVFPLGWYIDVAQSPPAPKPRPDFPGMIDKTAIAANGVDAATLSNLPVPAQVTVMNGPVVQSTVEVSTGSFAFTTASAGVFNLYVDGFPAKLFRTAVTAT